MLPEKLLLVIFIVLPLALYIAPPLPVVEASPFVTALLPVKFEFVILFKVPSLYMAPPSLPAELFWKVAVNVSITPFVPL